MAHTRVARNASADIAHNCLLVGPDVRAWDRGCAIRLRLRCRSSARLLYDIDCERNYAGCVDRFAARFGSRVIGLHGFGAVDAFLEAHAEIRHLYQIKCNNDGLVSKLPHVRNYIHAVFDAGDPYGDVYAKISPCVPGTGPVVPHIVPRQQADGPDLRDELGIPADATVFGRYGGYESFDIEAAREAVLMLAREQVQAAEPATRPIFFIFMNTPPLAEPLTHIIHMERSSDPVRKSAFIRTCDAMLHARSCGETFGLAVAEFSAHNRPVLTSSEHHDNGAARMHLDSLGSRGLYYSSMQSLVALIKGFDRVSAKARDWNAYRSFEMEAVMRTFDDVFIKGSRRRELPDWKRWKHGGGGGDGGGVWRAPTKEQMAERQVQFQEQRRIFEELGRLRGLPTEAEVAVAPIMTFLVECACTELRLAPSISAGSNGTLHRGESCRVIARRGLWVRLEPDPASHESYDELPRWLLTQHPEDGRLAVALQVMTNQQTVMS